MRIVVVNFAYDARLRRPEELLDRYHSLTGWCEAILAAGASVRVLQRFGDNATVLRNGIEYRFHNRGVRRLVEHAQPDVVHVNGLDFPWETARLCRSLGSDTPLVVQDHASGDPVTVTSIAHAVRRGIRRRLMRPIDGFFFTADRQADGWRRAGLIGDGQPVYEVIEASTRMKPVDCGSARKESGIDGEPAVLWVGRLNANKDPMTVLDGFEQSLSQLPAATLSMVYSEGELLGAVRDRLAASARLSARVRLLGQAPPERMPLFYSAADLFVVGSHHEGSGYALLEACACGLTPLVTDIPAFRRITNGGSIGSLWPVGNAAQLADAMVRTASADRPASRNSVLAFFKQTLSWPAVGEAAMRAYGDVLARRRVKTA
jgi:glycosyltransferase involved in cell wall biosynthesis